MCHVDGNREGYNELFSVARKVIILLIPSNSFKLLHCSRKRTERCRHPFQIVGMSSTEYSRQNTVFRL
jgi:hypothetical protein